MKKLLFNLSLISFLMTGFTSISQVIPNPDFDSWTILPYNEPDAWVSSNGESLNNNGTVTTMSVNGFSGKGVRMQTNVAGNDTSFGYIICGGGNGDPIAGQGGMPYSQKPENITGYYKYNLPGNDTAVGFISFKKNGVVLCSNTLKIKGTGTLSAFTAFSFTLAAQSLTVDPDSVIIAFASSNAITNVGIQNGSSLELDQLSFTGSGITQPINNGDFENWTAKSLDKLNGWATAGSGISQIAPGQSGPYAIELRTDLYPGNFVGQSGITNGQYPTLGGPPYGGMPYTQTQDTLFGYYKFSGSNDSGVVFITLKKNGSNSGGAIKYLKTQAAWTLFKIPFSSGTTPDSMRIEIYSSQPGSSSPGAIGSVLSIDNLSLGSIPVALNEIYGAKRSYLVYPNPCEERLTLKFAGNLQLLRISDSSGKEIFMKENSSGPGQLDLDVQSLAPGLYFISLQSGNELVHLKFIKQ